jgi:hypothetical protein
VLLEQGQQHCLVLKPHVRELLKLRPKQLSVVHVFTSVAAIATFTSTLTDDTAVIAIAAVGFRFAVNILLVLLTLTAREGESSCACLKRCHHSCIHPPTILLGTTDQELEGGVVDPAAAAASSRPANQLRLRFCDCRSKPV